MHAQRHTEVNVLGYRIDHVRAGGAVAEAEEWHEVLCPIGGDVLARFASRAEAERFIIERELASARIAVRRYAV